MHHMFLYTFYTHFLNIFPVPIISTIIMSTQQILGPEDATYIGFKTIKNMIYPLFNALWVTTRYTVFTILLLIRFPCYWLFDKRKITPERISLKHPFLCPLTRLLLQICFRLAFGSRTQLWLT